MAKKPVDGTVPGAPICECVTTAERLGELESAWDALHARSSGAHLFQSYPWVSSWLRHRPEGRPLVLTARRGDQLTAALALCAHDVGPVAFGIRTLRVATDYSDFCDALSDPDYPEDLPAAWANFLGHAPWNVIDLHYVRPGSALASLCDQVPHAWRIHRGQQDVAPYLDLSVDWRETVGKGHRSDWLRRRRRLEERGGLTLTRAQTPAEIDALLEEFVRLHIDRWRAKGETSAYALQETREFLRDVCHGLQRRGQLRLYRLAAGSDTVSIGIYTLFGARLMPYSYVFAPEYARFSPIHLLILSVVEEIQGLGLAEEHDFGRGDEEYKLSWTQKRRALERIVIARRSLRGRLAWWWAVEAKPALWRHPRLHVAVREMRTRLRRYRRG
ncbi:MAG TPA: GNAT family N-acetyltransferase [Armatimonadetes bacterium]|nr:GNAT family N-acetyltransferase [Armatimonadota bacterium]